MKIITSISEMQSLVASIRQGGKTIGFVPTMGFLHEGHLSLMRKSKEEHAVSAASIFVNPAQFGPEEDLERYPRDAEGDRRKCEFAGVDLLFMPAAPAMYPEKQAVFVTVDALSGILEGAIRPGHFRGVATVVAKLFNIVKPHKAYFGQKDYQQCLVIRKMVKDLNFDVDVVVMPTVREADGLAMSSRNSYLNADERRISAVLYRALIAGRDRLRAGTSEPEILKKIMREVIASEHGVSLDYIEIADPETLSPLGVFQEKMVLLIAARLGQIRLIDNLLIP